MDTLEEKRKRSGYDGTEGTPHEEVQKLCDVHAALFRAAAPEAEEAADPSLLRKQRAEKTRELTETAGHPLSAFHRENQALEKLIEKAKTWKEEKDIDREALEALQGREKVLRLLEECAQGPLTLTDYPRDAAFFDRLRQRVNKELSGRL